MTSDDTVMSSDKVGHQHTEFYVPVKNFLGIVLPVYAPKMRRLFKEFGTEAKCLDLFPVPSVPPFSSTGLMDV